MGRDKALLPWQGATLLDRMLAIARAAGAAAIAVSGPKERYGAFGVPCIPDQWPGAGPLGGMASVLRESSAPRHLMLGCDMPFLSPEFLRWLWRLAAAHEGWVVPQLLAGRFEPLCAVYARSLLPTMEAALKEGRYKIDRALAKAPQRRVTAAEFAAAGFAPEIFRNLNRPEDCAQS